MKPTQEQILAWAREAGSDDWGLFRDFMPEIDRLVTLAFEAGRMAENAACEKLCTELTEWHSPVVVAAYESAAEAIRARREQ